MHSIWLTLHASNSKQIIVTEIADWQRQQNKNNSYVFAFYRYHRTYNKKSGRWSVYACREEKTYQFVDGILECALVRRLREKTGMYRNVVLSATDPRQIASHLPPVEPQPTAELVKEHVSRFKWIAVVNWLVV